MLVEGLILSKVDEDCWVLQTPEGRHIQVNHAAVSLLNILKNESDLSNAVKQFNQQFNVNIDEPVFLELVKTKLFGFNFFVNEDNVKPYKKEQYLRLKFSLFNARISGVLSTPFLWIFQKHVFWTIFIGLIINFISTIFLFPSPGYSDFTKENLFIFCILVYPSILLHELGHIAACKRYDVKHGEIGFGFYLLFPVLYADVTNIWMIEKPRRIIVNLAGVTNELFYATVIFIIFLLTQFEVLMFAYYAIVIKALFELNPFLRLDGYWTLSDITGTPNLLKKSNLLLKQFLTGKPKNAEAQMSAKNTRLWMILYAIFNNLIGVVYCSYIIIIHFHTIIMFPKIIMGLITKAVELKLGLSDFKIEYGLVLLFYIIVIRKTFDVIKNILEKRVLHSKPGIVRTHG